MAPLTLRQEKAQKLADELGRCRGCWVVTPLPLDNDTRGLRVQILDSERDSVVEELCGSGRLPNLVSPFPRFTSAGLVPASMFEIEISKERQPVPDSPKIESGMVELAERQAKTRAAAELKAFRKAVGITK
jgi:hypothetical protein